MPTINKFLMFFAVLALTLNFTPSVSAQEEVESESFGIGEIDVNVVTAIIAIVRPPFC